MFEIQSIKNYIKRISHSVISLVIRFIDCSQINSKTNIVYYSNKFLHIEMWHKDSEFFCKPFEPISINFVDCNGEVINPFVLGRCDVTLQM